MKKLLLLLLGSLFLVSPVYPDPDQQQWVHQYVVIQAYQLLRQHLGFDVPIMQDHVGAYEQGDGAFNPGGLISIGTYREDEEDIVWGYGAPFGWNTTNTHFWDPDNGDGSHFQVIPTQAVYENAYTKARRFFYGGYELRVYYPGNGITEAYSAPSYLPEYYKTGTIYYRGFYNTAGEFTGRNLWVTSSQGFRDRVVWEILGRVAHLLADVGTPTHAHYDQHDPVFGGTDLYESEMGSQYVNYDYNLAQGLWGLIDVTGELNPLKYLFYTTAQIADHYPSNDVGGDNGWGINEPFTNYQGLSDRITILGPIPSGAYTPQIAYRAFTYSISTTAGLLHWFAVEAGLITRTIVKNDFGSGTVKINAQTRPSGTTFSVLNGTTVDLDNTSPQLSGDYQKYFSEWNKLDAIGNIVETHDVIWWSLPVQGKQTYNARFNNGFAISVTNPLFMEPGSGGGYRINGSTEIVSSWMTTFIENVSPPISLEAVPPSGDWIVGGWSDGNTQNPRTLIPTNHVSGLYAIMKMPLRSASPTALSTNQQRKLSRWREINSWTGYRLLYESGGQIWDVLSTNMGAAWVPERLLSTNPGTHRSPSLATGALYLDVPSNHHIVWHTNAAAVDQIWYQNSSLLGFNPPYPPKLVGTLTPHQSIPPAPVIAFRGSQNTSLLAAYTGANSIEIMKSNNNGTTWFRDTYSNSLSARYRPSLASEASNIIYLTYDNNSRVFFDYYYRHSGGNEGWWRVLGGGPEDVVPGSVSNRSGFRGASQVVLISPGLGTAGVVWQMREGWDAVTDAPVEEEMEADVQDEDAIPVSEYSVCFQRKSISFPWGPVKKFVGNNYKSPTISYLTNGRMLWTWTNGGSIFSSQSTDYGVTWSAPVTLHEGVDPQAVIGAENQTQPIKYAYRNLFGPVYEIAFGAGSGMDEETFGATHEMSVTEDSSNASLNIEMLPLWLKTTSNSMQSIPFAIPEDSAFLASANNIEQYLSATSYAIPQNADSVYLRIRMSSKSAWALAQQNVPLRVKVHCTVDGSVRRTIAQWRFGSDNYLNKTFRIPARRFRGTQVKFDISILGLNRANPDLRASVASVHRSGTGHLNKSNAQHRQEIPQSYGLSQNYPNPFNPSTEIRFDLPDAANVSLVVYDVLGREIATLASGQREAGYHSATWNASDRASGVYFARLDVRDDQGKMKYSKVNKLVMMK